MLSVRLPYETWRWSAPDRRSERWCLILVHARPFLVEPDPNPTIALYAFADPGQCHGRQGEHLRPIQSEEFMPKMTPVFRRLPEVAINCPSMSMEVNFAYLAARSRKDKGEIAACRNCGSRSVGVHLYESDWISGGAFRVVLEAPTVR
jgi:hypothetical protein